MADGIMQDPSICPKCQKPYMDLGKSTSPVEVCKCPKEPFFPIYPYTPTYQPQIGWICPKCGAGLSPWTQQCGCSGYKITYTTVCQINKE